jgi:crossover junction endodeoxyribonuclease RuvC
MEQDKSVKKERIILGIDPGTSIMGFGVLKIIDKKPQLITIGSLDLQKLDDHFVKLKMIFEETILLIDKYHPDDLAIEAPFYGKNIQSMLKLGRAQGTAISAALSRSIPIFEYAPRKIKMSITGQGSASKEQVAFMLQKMLGFTEMPQNLDATDGLAAAVCHFFQNKIGGQSTGAKSWKEFIGKNPGRVS